jgi:hypothetical protein
MREGKKGRKREKNEEKRKGMFRTKESVCEREIDL